MRVSDHQDYELGIWDCAIFIFDWAHEITGTDHIAEYRGRYTTHKQAERLMKKIDRVPTVRKLVAKKLGDPVPIAMARTGDVVMFDNSFGILSGGHGVFLAELNGYERVPRRLLEKAWHVRG